jgi:DNA polymerase I-like protein with 3'-5' exonuclease and polymerase domains
MNDSEACQILGIQPKTQGFDRADFLQAPLYWKPLPMDLPSENWRAKAHQLAAWANQELFSPKHKNILEKLQSERGITQETAKKFGLGYIQTDLYINRLGWDLPLMDDHTGDLKRLFIPAGLVIPGFYQGQICRLRIRKSNREDGYKYHIVPNSSRHPMITPGKTDYVMVVESDLDAILLSQEAGDLIHVMAMGSCSAKPDERAFQVLSQAEIILISLDDDDAGTKSAFSWWLKHFPHANFWPIIEGKDPTEAYLNGLDLREWVKAGIENYQDDTEEHGIQTTIDTVPRDNEEEDPIPTNYLEFLNHAEQFCNADNLVLDCFEGEIMQNGNYPSYMQLFSRGLPLITLDLSEADEDYIEILQALLACPMEKIAYDAKQTLLHLKKYNIRVEGPIVDLIIGNQVMMAGLDNPHGSLNDLADQYLYADTFSGRQVMQDHSASVMEIMLQIKEAMNTRLAEQGLIETAELEWECIKSVVEMESNGIRVDGNQASALLQELKQTKVEIQSRLTQALGNVNLDSPDQILTSLAKQGIAVSDTSKGTLTPLVSEHAITADLMDYRKATHGISILEAILGHLKPDLERIYPTYHQMGAPTGRMSCMKPNLQGIPKDPRFRSLFQAEPGYKFIIADYSQIELRIMAEMTRDEKMLEVFDQDGDLHVLTAAIITGKSDVSKEDRQKAKAVNFGFAYGMSAESFVKYALVNYNVVITTEEAQDFRNRYFQTYQGIKSWHDQQTLTALTCLTTLGGRTRRYAEDAPLPEKLNTPVQGTGADIIKKALCLLHERINGTEARIIGCVHDEIILEVPEDMALEMNKMLKDAMIQAGQVYLKRVPVKVDVRVSSDWAEQG